MRRAREGGAVNVKICCIASQDEANMAIDCGAAALGLVSAMPSGPGPIPEALIATIAASVPQRTATFLLTCLADAPAIIEQLERCATTTVQLVDEVADGTYAEIRAVLPQVEIVQVLHVTGEATLEAARRIAPEVDALLLDSGDPALAVKELGGTGRVHDWRFSRRIVEQVPCPVFLAGGLRAHNVGEAIRAVAPYGVDLCTGVRTDGHLDESKLRAFFAAVNRSAQAPRDTHWWAGARS